MTLHATSFARFVNISVYTLRLMILAPLVTSCVNCRSVSSVYVVVTYSAVYAHCPLAGTAVSAPLKGIKNTGSCCGMPGAGATFSMMNPSCLRSFSSDADDVPACAVWWWFPAVVAVILEGASDTSCDHSVSTSDANEYGNSDPSVVAGERGDDGGDDPT
ncbi:hypothetical protein PF005_g19940 [Phytophthora fragariae]|uniref:Uncharacterized protein n=1 Tax=Phytophthora fragariae TaxID=53985 RepID=A0A6A3WPC7_9STRA|nr:hypothetical protein PF003_g15128 [Phytophthora fragariae]KAE8945026.1 hypothetical protein PF009_g5310 [Phytophthora fragariae]KAE9086517.1 hypothetical protein PF007_g20745 [Phytophthora fragariae]KAE9151602.1 hypothetical protein PF006_g4132 [Phytophthora fragariae]KAE9188721.1 hypothetical protein PF005_g19940 [Phytophthora fragariae]